MRARGLQRAASSLLLLLPGLALGLVSALGGCAAPVEPDSSGSRVPPHIEQVIRLGDIALSRGDLAVARERYERALASHPNAAGAHAGLGRASLAQGRPDVARECFDRALAIDPDEVGALVGLARVEEKEGNASRARVLARRAVSADASSPAAHAMLAHVTGPAPAAALRSARTRAQREALAENHPYDARALLAGARARREAGDVGGARRLLEAVWLAEPAGRAVLAASDELSRLEGSGARSRVVWVHVHADETVRRDAAWEMRVRFLWRNLSEALHPFLQTQFVPVSFEGCSVEGAGPDLDSLAQACLGGRRLPRNGIVAFFTERRAPREEGRWQLGHAGLLGWKLAVRLQPGELESRVLAHEVVHIYGGIHIADEIESLMNPSGGSDVIDPVNARILSHTRARRFGPFPESVNLADVDLAPVIQAYREMLRLNLGVRNAGMARARRAGELSRYDAARIASEVVALDPHLGDVANRVADWLVAQGELVAAAELYEAASRLYGPETRRGHQSQRKLQRLRDRVIPRAAPL